MDRTVYWTLGSSFLGPPGGLSHPLPGRKQHSNSETSPLPFSSQDFCPMRCRRSHFAEMRSRLSHSDSEVALERAAIDIVALRLPVPILSKTFHHNSGL